MRALFLCFVFVCLSFSAQSEEDKLVITNQRGQTVVLLGASSGKLYKTWPIEGDPLGVSVAGNSAFVTAPETGFVWRLPLGSDAVPEPVYVGGGPTAIVVNARADRVWVSLWYQREIVELCAPDWRVVRRMAFENAPAGLAFAPNSMRLYVAERDANRVAVVDLLSWELVQHVPVGEHPYGLALSTDELRLASADVLGNTLSVIDTLSLQLVHTAVVGDSPYSVTAHPLKQHWFVTNQGDDRVSAVDELGQVYAQFDSGSYPESVQLSTDAKFLYVTHWDDGTVGVLDIESGQMLKRFYSGEGARAFGAFVWRR